MTLARIGCLPGWTRVHARRGVSLYAARSGGPFGGKLQG